MSKHNICDARDEASYRIPCFNTGKQSNQFAYGDETKTMALNSQMSELKIIAIHARAVLELPYIIFKNYLQNKPHLHIQRAN